MREVILGLPGPWADDNQEASDHYTTKIGGLPDWPFPESCLGLDLLQCCACRNNLSLVSQVYAPISSAALKIEERVIYVFGCLSAQCGSWRAIRVQKPDTKESRAADSEVAPSVISSTSASKSKWLDDLYSFDSEWEYGDDEDMNMEELSRAFSETANLCSDSAKQDVKKHIETNGKPLLVNPKIREVDANVPVLPCFYIYSQEDTSSKHSGALCCSYSSLSIKESEYNEDNDDQKQEVWEEEGYEYDKALNADRTYLKFKKRVDACSEQCFRYSFGGKPLLATGNVGDPGACGICGESRHYEMQLMPSLVYFLQEAASDRQKDLLENWSWITLIVYACSKSCFRKADQETPNGHGWTVVEEAVVAQFE